MQRLTIF